MTTPDRVTLRYLLGFRCVAGSCRENCCTGLRVQLTEENHRKLAERSAALPQLKELFERNVRVAAEAERTPRAFAHIEPDAGQCPFLDPEWLCSIQRHAGEETLSDPCSLFPRTVTEVGGRLELSATLACPEAAKLCLTTEAAVDSVPYEPSLLAREIVVRRHDAASADPYVALLDDVRQLCLDVMDVEGAPTVAKLAALVDFATRVEPHFHRGTTSFDREAFAREASALVDDVRRFAPLRGVVGDEQVVRALAEIVLARLGGTDNQRFNTLFRRVLLHDVTLPRSALAAAFSGDRAHVKDLSALARVVGERTSALERRHGPQVDRYLHRVTVNSLVKDWYTQQPTLASSLRRLVVRLALARWALVMHPAFSVAMGAQGVDEVAIDVFQIVAKNVEHVPAFMELCERFLAEQRLDGADGVVRLLTV